MLIFPLSISEVTTIISACELGAGRLALGNRMSASRVSVSVSQPVRVENAARMVAEVIVEYALVVYRATRVMVSVSFHFKALTTTMVPSQT
jgi:hypothetical protein